MKSSDSHEKPNNKSSNERESAVNWTGLFDFWIGKAWSLPNSTDTACAVEHTLETCRTVFMTSQTATEALYDTARRQQELTFHLARTTLDACSPGMIDRGALEPHAAWKRMMAGYAEACHAGLEVTETMTGAAFNALLRRSAMQPSGSTDGASPA
jgi:hypothetical protein